MMCWLLLFSGEGSCERKLCNLLLLDQHRHLHIPTRVNPTMITARNQRPLMRRCTRPIRMGIILTHLTGVTLTIILTITITILIIGRILILISAFIPIIFGITHIIDTILITIRAITMATMGITVMVTIITIEVIPAVYMQGVPGMAGLYRTVLANHGARLADP